MRTAIVSGASSGIGYAVSQRLLQENWQVYGISRDFSKADSLTQSAQFLPVCLDLSDLDLMPDTIKQLLKPITDIHAVIFAAGQGWFAHLEQFSYQHIQQLMDINFTSQAYLARAVVPKMKQARQGDLVFIGSEAALKGSRQGTIYCASKFALRGFAQALRDECSASGVRVSIINPGMVKTAFFDDLGFEPGVEANESILPEDVADMVSHVLNMRRGTVIDEINCSPSIKSIRFKK